MAKKKKIVEEHKSEPVTNCDQSQEPVAKCDQLVKVDANRDHPKVIVTVRDIPQLEVANCDIKLGRNKKTSLCFHTRRYRNAE